MTVPSLEDPLEMLKKVRGEDAVDSLYGHSKTGDIYYIVDVAYLEKDLTPMVIYTKMDKENHIMWIRPMDEFFDGRFVQLNKVGLDHVST